MTVKRPPTERLLLRFLPECSNLAIKLPGLDIVAIDELFCSLDRCLIIRAIKLDFPEDVAVGAHSVNPVLGPRSPIRVDIQPPLAFKEAAQ